MIIPDVYIVGKGKEWLISYRPDILQMPHNHMWSKYMWDAKKFQSCKDARKRAKQYGGEVYRFNSVSGKAEPVKHTVPEICDTCRRYTPLDGTCKNKHSEYYMVPVGTKDSCDEWEDRA